MLTINNIPILVPITRIIADLSMELKLNGLNSFKKFRQTGINIQTNCPFHVDNKPSFSILLKDKGDIKAGTYNCFSCHRSGTLSELISQLLFNTNTDSGVAGDKWLLDNYAEYELDNRESVFKLPSRKRLIKPIAYINEDELNSYAFYHSYILNERKISKRIVDLFDVGYDAHFKLSNMSGEIPCITFPVRDINGNCLFIARRAIHTKLFNYIKDTEKTLYGVYELSKIKEHIPKLYITESIINCLTIWSAGGYAIALNGTGTEKQYDAIRDLPYRNIVLALDTGDIAGIRGTQKLWKYLKDYKLLTWAKFPVKTDINDLWVSNKNSSFLDTFDIRSCIDYGGMI